jgi:hypothetical protein
MSYATRSKDNPGDVGRAADHQQSIDNEQALWASLIGPLPTAFPPGHIRTIVKKTGIADNVATTIFTITTTNEGGNNDGGVWMLRLFGLVTHYGGNASENAGVELFGQCVRAMGAAGAGQNNLSGSFLGQVASSDGSVTKGIASITMTMVETSEYEVVVKAQIDLSGTVVTTGRVIGIVDLFWEGFATAPVVSSPE